MKLILLRQHHVLGIFLFKKLKFYISQVPLMTSETRGGNTSDEDVAGDDIPEPEIGSPWDDSRVIVEAAVPAMLLENSPVNAEMSSSDLLLANKLEACKMSYQLSSED
jgi:hypothetical protein